MDFPFPLTENNLRTAIADRRYYDPKHPDSATWRDMVSRGWNTLYPDGSLRGDHTDSLPRHQGSDGHIYASDGTRVAHGRRNLSQNRTLEINLNDPEPKTIAQPAPSPSEGSERNQAMTDSGGSGGGGGYNPNQPRDWHGRWIDGGGEGGSDDNNTKEPSAPQTPPADETPGGKPPPEIIESGPGWWRDADGLHIVITPPTPEEGNGSGGTAPQEQPPGGGSLPNEPSPPNRTNRIAPGSRQPPYRQHRRHRQTRAFRLWPGSVGRRATFADSRHTPTGGKSASAARKLSSSAPTCQQATYDDSFAGERSLHAASMESGGVQEPTGRLEKLQ